MQSVELKARGLYTFFNDLSENPPGALVEALNVVIDRNSIIEPRRGLTQYGSEFGISTERAKQLIEYKDRILFHHNDKIGFDSDNQGAFLDFDGSYTEADPGIRIKSIEANSNLYFTTKEGIKKISARTPSDFSTLPGFIKQAGGVKALDVVSSVNYTSGGFFVPLSKVAYRVVWGITDINDNLILGNPSSRTVLENISSLDSGTVDLTFSIPDDVDSENYFYQIYRTGVFTASSLPLLDQINPGDEMYLVFEDFVTTADIISGSISVSDITPEDLRQNGALLYTNPVSGTGIEQANEPPPFAKDITQYQGYTFFANTSTVERLNLSMLSIQDLISGVSSFTIDDTIATRTYTFVGAFETYTVDFTGMVFPGGKASLDGKYFTITSSRDLRTYKIWFDNTGTTIEPLLSGSLGVKVDTTAIADTATAIAQEVETSLLAETNDFNTIEIAGVLTVECSNNGEVTTAITENIAAGFSISKDGLGVGEDTSAQEIFLPKVPGANQNGPSVSQQIDQAARSIVTVLNADTSKIVAAFYLSGSTDIPGQILLEHKDITGNKFSIIANSVLTGAQFNPTLPTSGISVSSENEVRPNRIYYSKFQQPEAVPLVNFIDVGPKDEEIQRIIALRDSLFIFKEDAIYRLTGLVAPFQVYPFDSSAILQSPDSAVVLNNLVYGFSTQGVITVSDTGVSVISRPIEDKLLSITRDGFDFRNSSFAVAYETDRAYLLWTVTEVGDTVATQCFRYNSFTNSWTRWDVTASSGLVNKDVDKLFIGAGDFNFIERERKSRTRIDYADRQYDITIIADEVNGREVKVSSTSDISIGDVILQTQYLTISQYNRLLNKLDTDPTMPADYFSTLEIVAGDSITTKMSALVTKLNIDDTSQISNGFTGADVNIGTDTISIAAHGYSDGKIVYFTNDILPGNLPGGLSINTKYYIVSSTANTFKVSLSDGGPAVDITSIGSNNHTVSSDYNFSGSTDFETIQTEFNNISEKLEKSTNVFFTSYPTSTGTVDQESIVISIDSTNTVVTVTASLPYISGNTRVYKSIKSKTTWSPVTFQDVSMTKHVRSGTIIFEDNNFTQAKVSYATDNSPSFEEILFGGQGVGDWGQFSWGDQFWGGISSSKPLRTLIPLQKQRCRYMIPRFEHGIAFEKYSLYGMSFTYRITGPRGYR